MLMFKRRHREEPVKDVWGPQFNPRRVPVGPDSVELDRLVLRLHSLVELRGHIRDREQTKEILSNIESEIQAAMTSPTKHRDWRETRARVLELIDELGTVLYREQPESYD